MDCYYKRYEVAEELLTLHEFSKGENHLEFHKMCITGELEFCDYGRGFLVARICASRFPYPEDSGPFGIRLGMITIDDGDLGGYILGIETFEEAAAKARQIAEVFAQWTVLPTLKEINEQLYPLGICLEYGV